MMSALWALALLACQPPSGSSRRARTVAALPCASAFSHCMHARRSSCSNVLCMLGWPEVPGGRQGAERVHRGEGR